MLSILCFAPIISLAQDKNLDAKIQSIVKNIKNNYIVSAKKQVSLSWAPATDPDYGINKIHCRNKNKPKSEKIGTLTCVNISTIKYTVNKGNAKINLYYSTMTGDLYEFSMETVNQTPTRKYLYRVNYPNADLIKSAVIFNNISMMSFNPSGKLEAYVYDDKTGCKMEDSKGQIVESPNSRNLCRTIVTNSFK